MSRLVVLVASLAWLAGLPALAAFPEKPITLVVTYAVGGDADVQMRVVARYLEKEFSVPFVVRNVVGASGQLAWDQVARGQTDGYTWVNINLPQMVTQPAARETTYRLENFEPLVLFREQATALATAAESKVTISELVSAARKQPGQLPLGVGGKWTHHDLGFYLFEAAANVRFSEVDVDGQAEIVQLLLGRHLDAAFGNVPGFLRMGSKIRILAVASKGRTPELPDAPTFEELGFPGVVSVVTMGIGVAKGTPLTLVNSIAPRLHRLFKTNQELTKDLEKVGGSPWFLLDREQSIRYIAEKRGLILGALKARGMKLRE